MEWVAALMFVTVVLVLLAGFPVAFTLGGTALIPTIPYPYPVLPNTPAIRHRTNH